eukprot:1845219-Rhodomonas_salina.3
MSERCAHSDAISDDSAESEAEAYSSHANMCGVRGHSALFRISGATRRFVRFLHSSSMCVESSVPKDTCPLASPSACVSLQVA